MFLSDRAYTAANSRDVLKYVTHRLEKDKKLKSKVAALTPAQAAALPNQITGKAEGNFLYAAFLLNAAAEGQQALDALDRLPSGLDGLYYNSLDRVVKIGKKDWATVYKPLLGVLSVAMDPLAPEQVQTYAGLPGDAWDALMDLRQFVETSSERLPENDDEEPEDRYRLYHQSMVDFLRRRQILMVVDGQRKSYDNVYRVMAEDWHRRIADFYWDASHPDWSRWDSYCLRHLAVHLEAAGRATDLHPLLYLDRPVGDRRENVWYTEKEAVGDAGGYVADLERAWRKAKTDRDVVTQVRYALCLGSIRNIGFKIPALLLELCLTYGVLTWQRAQAFARMQQIPVDRAEILGRLAPLISAEVERDNALAEALDAACAIDDDGRRGDGHIGACASPACTSAQRCLRGREENRG